MVSAEIKDKVEEFIKANFYVADPSLFTGSTSLIDQGVIDSTGVLEVVVFLEQEFGFRVEDSELVPENLDSLDGITAYVKRKRNSALGVAAA